MSRASRTRELTGVIAVAAIVLSVAVATVRAQETAATSPATRPLPVVRIGALAYRGPQDAIDTWQPTADYLSSHVPGYRFEIVPLGFDQINNAVATGKVDFVATSPANYVELENGWGATRIATLLALHHGVVCTRFAAVIFIRADRSDITDLNDLRGHSFMATDPNSFGGWWMAWRVLRDPDGPHINPQKDFKPPVQFAGTQDAVVYAVRDGKADAGTVRADLLEQMASEGKIRLEDFRILNKQPPDEQYPFPRSTQLYPQWPMARLRGTSNDLARDVAVALLQMPPDSPAAKAARSAGWTIPLDYTPVHQLLLDLDLPPYRGINKVTMPQALRQHLALTIAGAVILFLLIGTLVFFVAFSQRLRRLRRRLTYELAERQKAQEALSESEQRHRAVVQQAADGITLVDAESLQLLEVNQAFERLLGYSREELIGQPISRFIVDSTQSIEQRARQTVQSVSPTVGQRQYRRKDGSIVDVEKSATVLQLGGRKVLCTVVHDVSERRRAQKLLEQKNAQLEEAIESERQAHEALKSTQSQLVQAEKLAGLGQMVAGVAHEINNPLSFVANNVAVLQRDLKSMRDLLELYRQQDSFLAEQRPEIFAPVQELAERIDLNYTLGNLDEMLVRCREGLRRIQQIVKDLRDFARLDESDRHEADLNAGIQSTVNIILGRAKKKQVQIDLQLGNLPLVVCYPAKLNQVVMNLLSNAIDASPQGSSVTVASRAVDGEVQIEVADHGIGIDPAIRSRIFDPFFTTKLLGEGTGLGLSISYGIVKDHGGRIDVDSTPGQGSRFTVHLPQRSAGDAK